MGAICFGDSWDSNGRDKKRASGTFPRPGVIACRKAGGANPTSRKNPTVTSWKVYIYGIRRNVKNEPDARLPDPA